MKLILTIFCFLFILCFLAALQCSNYFESLFYLAAIIYLIKEILRK